MGNDFGRGAFGHADRLPRHRPRDGLVRRVAGRILPRVRRLGRADTVSRNVARIAPGDTGRLHPRSYTLFRRVRSTASHRSARQNLRHGYPPVPLNLHRLRRRLRSSRRPRDERTSRLRPVDICLPLFHLRERKVRNRLWQGLQSHADTTEESENPHPYCDDTPLIRTGDTARTGIDIHLARPFPHGSQHPRLRHDDPHALASRPERPRLHDVASKQPLPRSRGSHSGNRAFNFYRLRHRESTLKSGRPFGVADLPLVLLPRHRYRGRVHVVFRPHAVTRHNLGAVNRLHRRLPALRRAPPLQRIRADTQTP